MIIGITGNIKAGKDTVAKMIQYYFWNKLIFDRNIVQTKSLIDFLKDYDKKHIKYYKECSDENRSDIWQIKKFAAKLKETISNFTGCTLDQLESCNFKENFCYNVTTGEILHCGSSKIDWINNPPILKVQDEYPDNSWVTFRVLLQDIGMKLRSSISKIHINGLFANYTNEQNWIISDLRLINEAETIIDKNGIIIKITRGDKSNSEHISETELNSIIPNFHIENDGTIEELYDKVSDFLKNSNL